MLAHSDRDGSETDTGLLFLGADYRLNSRLLVGLLGQVDFTDMKDAQETASVEGVGWMVGPYLVARVHDNLVLDARVAAGASSNDIRPFNTYEDEFDTFRWLIKGQATGDFRMGAFSIAPQLSAIYIEETQEAYTDSNSIRIDEQTASLGRLTFGPRVSTQIQTADGALIAPFAALRGLWDFERDGAVDLDTGVATSDEEFRARAEAGLDLNLTNAVSIGAAGFYDGLGADDFESYGGSLRLSIPF